MFSSLLKLRCLPMNFLSSFLDDRNLLLENEKTAFAGRFFRRFFEFAAQKTTVTGLEERSNQICPFSLALTGA